MFFLPLFDELPTSRRPFITWIIFLLCVIGFFWQQSLTDKQGFVTTFQFGFVPALFLNFETLPPDMIAVPSWATLVTSMFLHGGWLHIAGNMLYLWIFGDNVENAMGSVRFIIFYLLCGCAAALAQAAIDPLSTVPMIGASGGVAGILGAYLLLHPKAAVRCFLLIIVYIRFINLPAWLVLGVWIGGQFVAVPEALANTGGGGVAYMAHIGGFSAGIILIPFFKKHHVSLFDRGQPPKTWSGAPISYSDLKAQARERYHRRAHANKTSQLARGSVPSHRKPDRRSGPWG